MRDFTGYGAQPPHAAWPHQAKIAVQFVLNYEEGSERSVLEGDAHAETFLSEIIRVWNPARVWRSNSTRRPHNQIRPGLVGLVPVSPPPRPWAKKACGFSKSTYVCG